MADPALYEPGGIRSNLHRLCRPAAAIARGLGDDFGKSGPSAKRLARRLSLVAFRRGPARGSHWASCDFFLDERLRLRVRSGFCSVRFRILVGSRVVLSRWRGVRRVLYPRAYDNRPTLRSRAARHGNGLVSLAMAWIQNEKVLLQLDSVVAAPVRKVQRVGYEFETRAFVAQHDQQRLPAGFTLARLNAALMREVADTTYPWVRATWKSELHFERYGLGFCVLTQGRIVSLCYSIFVSGSRRVIDILTVQPYRRHGLARAVASAYIQECLDQGLQPGWGLLQGKRRLQATGSGSGVHSKQWISGLFLAENEEGRR